MNFNTHDWMSKLPSDRKLSEILMPGSHDAGLYEVTGSSVPNSWVITQEKTIGEQLKAGVRCFDLRVYNKRDFPGVSNLFGGKLGLYVGHFAEPVFKGHSIGGGFGPPFWRVLFDIKSFFLQGQSSKETVILRLSHIKKSNLFSTIYFVLSILSDNLYLKNKKITIGNEKLRNLRGKIITIYENSIDKHLKQIFKDFNSLESSSKLLKFKDSVVLFKKAGDMKDIISPEKKKGKLILRGKYSNKRRLESVFEKQERRLSDWSSAIEEDRNKYDGELMQLYWTSTGSATSKSRKIIKNTRALWTRDAVRQLTGLIQQHEPNIVWMDFCNSAKSLTILRNNNFR